LQNCHAVSYLRRMTHELIDDVKDMILEELAERPLLNAAARAVGIKPIDLRRAIDADAAFEAAVGEAINIGKGEAEIALWERGVKGMKSPVVHGGKIVMVIDEESGQSVPLMECKYSDKLLELYLKSQMSETYGERSKVEIEGTAVLVAPATPDLDSFRDMLSAHRKKERDGDSEGDE